MNEFAGSEDIVTPRAFKVILKWIDNVILLKPGDNRLFTKHDDFLDWAHEVYLASEYLGIHSQFSNHLFEFIKNSITEERKESLLTFVANIKAISLDEQMIKTLVSPIVTLFKDGIIQYEDEWFLSNLGRSKEIGKLLLDMLCSEAI